VARAGTSIGRNTGYNLAGSVIPLLLSLVTVPLYLDLIGPDRYGVLAIAWLLLGYFGLFDLGLGRATSYRIAALRDAPAEERATTLWTAVAVNLAMGVAGAAVLWLVADWFFTSIFKVDPQVRPEIVAAVPFLALSVPVATLTGVLTGALHGREQFLRTNTISVTSTVLFQLFPLAVAWLAGPNLPMILVAALAARLVALAVLWGFCRAELTRGHKPRLDGRRFRELLSFGGWVSVTSAVGPVLIMADRFLIGAVLGAVAVTIYSVPFQLAQRIIIVPASLTTALFPRLSAAPAEEQRRLGGLALRTLTALMTLPVLAGIFIMGPFLELWVGREIGSQAAPIGRLLLVGSWVNSLALVSLIRLQASGRPDKVAKIHLIEVVPYLLGLVLAMKTFGLLGCAAMFVARCLVDFLLLSLAAERRIDGLGWVAVNFALLLAAAALPSWTPPAAPAGLAIGGLLLACTALIGLVSLPAEIRQKIGQALAARSPWKKA
jgi:O-antigen/teichoic acid export membrane protein